MYSGRTRVSGWEYGNVGCCDSSPGKHATSHFFKVGHLVIRSVMPEPLGTAADGKFLTCHSRPWEDLVIGI
jgi:hypothetical protein